VADEATTRPEHAFHLQEQMLFEWLTAHAESTDRKQAQSAAVSERL